jgi:polysaccharide deacetylase family protein (PEP-CTERM system associated)
MLEHARDERREPAPRQGVAEVILTIDLEDWHQLVSREAGVAGWDLARPPFPRQVEALLELLADMRARATFFVLGVTSRRYPEVLGAVARAGHAIASHGYAHHPVWQQSRGAFRDDVRRSVDEIVARAGAPPMGYRAPAFSIHRSDTWAYEVLADLGFAYDSSQHDTPRLARPSVPERPGPHRLRLPSGRSLFEFPPAVARIGRHRLPFGGGTYWRVLPDAVIRAAMRSHFDRGDAPTVYFHPYEFDPRPLRLGLASAAARLRELRYNFRRRGIGARLRRLSRGLSLIACEDYLEQHHRSGPRSLS